MKALPQKFVVVLSLLLMAGIAFGQTNPREQLKSGSFGKSQLPEVLGSRNNERIPMQVPEEAVFAVDAQLDPSEYILGAGDVVAVSLRGAIGQFYQTMITPDGRIIIPGMPKEKIGGMSLMDAEKYLGTKWKGAGKAELDLALLQMRRIRVSIGGLVERPGQYILTPADRVTTLMEMAGWHEEEASKRHVLLIRKDGTKEYADILRYLRFGSFDANPRLFEGDHVVINDADAFNLKIEIGGGVHIPGRYEYLKGDDLADVIELAGGLKEDDTLDTIFVFHHSTQSVDGAIERIAVDKFFEKSDSGPELQPGDVVLVRRIASHVKSSAVTVNGEVAYPGVYPIVLGQTKVSDIISLAGGFTENADLKNARVWKGWPDHDFRNMEAVRLDTTQTNVWNRIEEEYMRYYFRSFNRDFIDIDFEALFGEDGQKLDREHDVYLLDSLVVNIPEKQYTIVVTGQVRNPGRYQYEAGKPYSYYIKQAGGYTKTADKKTTRWIQFESSTWIQPDRNSRISAGDMLFVAEKELDRDFEVTMDIIQVLLNAGTLVTLIYRTFIDK